MPKLPSPAPAQDLLDNLAVVLLGPKYPENIGAAARVAMNMGITRLVVVRDEPPEQEAMLKMATHVAAPVIEAMALHPSLEQALAPYSMVVGTTARSGRKRRIENTPRRMVETIRPLLAKNRVALLFGPEDRGLTNEDLKFCQLTVTIPTADFSSLNLAQAVAILCYELHAGLLAAGGLHDRPAPKLAPTHELEAMYLHVEQLLNTIGFLKTGDSAYWMRNIRRFLGRIGLRAKEARLIRGFCRQFQWHEKRRGEKEELQIEGGCLKRSS